MALPVLGTLSVSADLEVEIPVDDMGGHALVRVDYAVLAGSAPDNESHHWQVVESVASPSTVTTVPQLYGSTVWVRASGRLADGEQASGFTAAVSIDIDDIARFSAINIALNDSRRAVVTWTAAALTNGVRIAWELHDPDLDPGSLGSDVELDADDGSHTIDEQVGQAITVTVQAWTGWTGSAVSGDMGQTVTETLVAASSETEPLIVRTESGDAYTLVLADGGTWLRFDDPSGVTVTVPAASSVEFPIGTVVYAEQASTGPVAFEVESPAMLNSLDAMLMTAGQYAVVRLVKVGENEWTLYGDLVS